VVGVQCLRDRNHRYRYLNSPLSVLGFMRIKCLEGYMIS